MNIKTPQQIDQVINEGQYKYVELVCNGKKYGGYNQTPSVLKKKVESIKKFIENLPDGVYTLNFKMSPGGDIFPYSYTKGHLNENFTPAPIIQHVPVPSQLEKFQTLDEWKKQEQKISALEQELALLKMQQNLTADLKEPEEQKSAILGFAENVLPTFVPVIDRFFQLKERELIIKEKNAERQHVKEQQKPQRPVQKIINKFRPIPSIGTDEFMNYLNYFLNLPEHLADKELDYLETNNGEIYNYILTNYYNEDESDQDIQQVNE